LAYDLIALATRHHLEFSLPAGSILYGWVRSASGDTAEGISRIEDGIRDFRATGAWWLMPFWLAIQAEALHLADRTPEALEACFDRPCPHGLLENLACVLL
jgi:hypothetical protein